MEAPNTPQGIPPKHPHHRVPRVVAYGKLAEVILRELAVLGASGDWIASHKGEVNKPDTPDRFVGVILVAGNQHRTTFTKLQKLIERRRGKGTPPGK